MPATRTRTATALAALALAATASGCGYSVRPPFDAQIRTVYVPVFRSVSFRRDVNLQLTEILIKEIEARTPFKVVGKPEGADSTLEGVINFSDKNIILENPFNLPRQLTATITVGVTWTDNRTTKTVKAPVVVTEMVNFFPEVGESSFSAFYRTNQKLAQQIVGMMEQKW